MATSDPDDVRQAWDEIATGFDEHATPLTIPLAETALDRVDLGEGTRFLDVAAGSGALSVPAARRGATVVATDIAPTMVECLEARARAEGLSTLEARVMDGCALDLADDSFDVAGSQNGVSLFPDVERGLGELVRVTRPGGEVLLVAFGDPRQAEFLGVFMGTLEATIPGFEGPPMDPPPLPFQMADRETLRGLLVDARLDDVAVEAVTWEMPFRSGEHFWNMIASSNPIGAKTAAELSPAQVEAVERALEAELRKRSGGGWPAVLTTEVNIGTGTK